jgi:hypothetical protein
MAKKKRTAKRSTKVGKRRPTTKRTSRRKGGVGAATAAATGSAAGKRDATAVSAAAFQRGAFQPDAFQTGGVEPSGRNAPTWTTLTVGPQELGLPRSNSNATLQSTQGVSQPPSGALELNTTPPEISIDAVSSMTVDAVIPAPIKQEIAHRLSTQPVDIRETARALAHAFKQEAENLRSHRPNDRSERELAKYDDLVSFLEKMAAGLTNLAAALDEAIKETTEGSVEPARLTNAAQITHNLQQAVMQWLENNVGNKIGALFDVTLFISGTLFLHSLGADSVAAISALGWIIRGTGKRKDPPEKKDNLPKKKRK